MEVLRQLSSEHVNPRKVDQSPSQCLIAGGVWPTIQIFILFLVTNIFAHAASIRPAPRADFYMIAANFIFTLTFPIYAGLQAFIMIQRRLQRASQIDSVVLV